MAKITHKKSKDSAPKPSKKGILSRLKFSKKDKTKKQKPKKAERIRLHKTFKRSYREDYVRELKAPGLFAHTTNTFKLLFKNWKIFIPFLIFIVFLDILLVGLLSEESYVNFQEAIDETNAAVAEGKLGNFGRAALTLVTTIPTGGLSNNMGDVQQVFVIILGLIIWLVTIYLVRHLLAGHKPRMRDGLYNALTPLISTFFVLCIIVVEAIPIMIVVVTYSAAVSTEFLNTPFYALVYFTFAALLVLLSVYLISSSFLALIAVTAPGLYPLAAINTATDLVAGRRIRFIIRIFFAFLVLAICWMIIMIPIIMLDSWFKSWVDWLANFPFVPFCLAALTAFSFMFVSAYSYLFYRQLLDFNDK